MGKQLVSTRRGQAGMTLVEIMITLVISSIIAASTFMFFAGQQRIYETQTRLLNVQQNLWAAMEVVARYARASGSGMFQCVRPASYANTREVEMGQSRLLSAAPSDSPVTSDGSRITSLASRPLTGLRAWDQTNQTMQWIPPLWIVDNSSQDAGVRAGSDILTVAFGNRTSGTDIDATLGLGVTGLGGGSVLTLAGTNTGNMFRAGEFILLLVTPEWGYGEDPRIDRGCTLLQISDSPANSSLLQHRAVADPVGGLIWNPAGNVTEMYPNTGYNAATAGVRNFGQLTWVSFYVATGSNGIPNLMMQQRHLSGTAGAAQVLAEGIEDLQVSFACDTGIRGVYDLTAINGQLDEGYTDATRSTDEWWNNVPDDHTQFPAKFTDGFCNLPTAVRITLVARTLSEDDLFDKNVTSNAPIDVENHRYSPRVPDGFRRRVLSTTIYPRNNKPL